MAVQTKAQLNTRSLAIKNATLAASNTATVVGSFLEDSNDSLLFATEIPYKILTGKMSYDGTTLSFTFLANTTAATGASAFIPSNGTIQCIPDQPIFTAGKTHMPSSAISTNYFLHGNRVTDSLFQFDIFANDGTQSGTPNFTDVYFIIHIYP